MVAGNAVAIGSPVAPSPLLTPSSTASKPSPGSNLRFVPTLLRKNWKLKRSHPLGLLVEILLPVAFIALMSVIKHQAKTVDVPAGFSEGKMSNNLFTPGGWSIVAPDFTPRYAIPETTLSGLLLHLNNISFHSARNLKEMPLEAAESCKMQVMYGGRSSMNKSSPYAVPEICQGRLSPYKLAIIPDSTFTRRYFFETIKQWYPTTTLSLPTDALSQMTNASLPTNVSLVIPSIEDMVVFYNSEAELESYIRAKDYAKSASQHRIFGALVFEKVPSDDRIGTYESIEMKVRINNTFVDPNDDDARYVPFYMDPSASKWNMFEESIDTLYYQEYTTGGFMTLQTLIARFVNCMPKWDATTKTTTGECQARNSTALNSTELDSRLLKTVLGDPATKQVASYLLRDLGVDLMPLMQGGGDFDQLIQLTDEQKESLLKPVRQAPQPYLGATSSPLPIQAYAKSTFYNTVDYVFPLFFILVYVLTLSKVLVSLITERETRARELMKILGVKESSIVVSWYITYTLILIVSTGLQVVAAKLGIFENTHFGVLWLFFFLFSMSILGFGFLISSVFSKARTGTYIGLISFFIMYGVTNAFGEGSSESSRNSVSFLSPVALVFAVRVLAKIETGGKGLNFSNLSSLIENYRFSTALAFFVFDAVIYTLLGLYFEKVVPKAFGTTEKWYFLFQPSFWRRRRSNKLVPQASRQVNDDPELAVPVNPNIEPVSGDLLDQERNGESFSVRGMRKVFKVPGGEKVAVKNMNLNMYSGQITCLLGHNGAGKTTLINMLTGVLSASSGDAYFRGMSIREDMNELRESLGICFQHDVLYPELNVEDHLKFYARIKGYTGSVLQEEVDKKIEEVGLSDKRSTLSSALSGGMKRKLSVAIALLGDSSLVFLDEPTSGMDPYSRRSTWEILMNNRHGRVMVLTTHFMDEADILGDRIAIMAEGELRCCGSPLFLKNRYGAGYNLTIVKQEGCDDAKVIDFVLGHIPSGQVLSNVGTEVAFQLPLDASSHFASMFRDLDARLHDLGLLSYGVSVTTMEEVFIKVAEAGDEDQQHTLQNTVKQHANIRKSGDTSVSGDARSIETKELPRSYKFGQFCALVQKRFRIAKRDRKFLVISLLLPIAWMVMGLFMLQLGDFTAESANMVLETTALEKEAPNHQVLLPSFCEQSVGDWCSSALSSSYFSGASPIELSQSDIGNPAYSTPNPTVFDVAYDNSTINTTDSTGYLLRLSEVIFDRKQHHGAQGQFGGYLMHSDSKQRVLGYNLLLNTTLLHGSIVFKGYMDQSIYRLMAKQVEPTKDVSTVTLKISNHPLPLTVNSKNLLSSYMSFTACLFFAIAFGYYPASIVALLVRERHPDHNSKHQQLVSGVNLVMFWLANYVWDLLVYIIPGGAALILIQVFKLHALIGDEMCVKCTSGTFPAVITLFVLFGLAICPFAYCWSFIFRNHASAQTKMILINFVLGLGLQIVSFAMSMIQSTEDLSKALMWVYRFSPIFSLSNGLVKLTIIEIINNGGAEWDTKHSNKPFALENAGYEMIFLVIDAVLYFALAVGLDYAQTFPKLKSLFSRDPNTPPTRGVQDEDVAAEAERVLMTTDNSDVIKLHNLRKVYRRGAKVAVNDLSFGLKRGECFGFLGINGAGKTTTMKMLTGDIVPTSGGATLCGFDILTQQIEVRRRIGYCPQFDALIDLLSVREHLELFAKIKGVPNSELDGVVNEKIEQLNLTDFADKLAGTLSGGNKRKLSVAIAMIGSPSILFLDEPSTGMDPVSRRFMWDVISEISTYNKSSTVVLTTHSMEECEALCTRVGIMVGGALKCLGSIQHLKNRFGDGLMFDAKLASPPQEEITALLAKEFGSVSVQITREQLGATCARFGDASWEQKIVNTHPTGFTLEHSLQRDGYVTASAFAAWWLMESRFENVSKFLQDTFGSVELLERQHDSCWFKIRDQSVGANGVSYASPSRSDRLRLSRVFERIESAKAALAIREYSVSQTTLEQIFNTFASQQHADRPIVTTPTNSDAGTPYPF